MKKILRSSRLFILTLVVAGLATVGYLAYKGLVLTPEVAEIAQTSTGTCQTNITSISFHDECSPGMFKKAIYTCTSGAYAEKLSSSNCFSYDSIISEAKNNCGQTCTAPPPRVSPSPTPRPSCIPNPCKDGAVCKLLALPEGQVYCPPLPPSPSLRPSPSPVRPSLGMTSFRAEKPCGPYGFSSISYSCNNNKMLNIMAEGQCIELKVALAKAQSSCAGGSE